MDHKSAKESSQVDKSVQKALIKLKKEWDELRVLHF